ncbi:protein of unknown function DUF1393 [Pseudobacteroides cellulosolvens ATCC 35603 = DSM 2933]|uniref:ECF transporter, substrate-specific component n=2 Tax=Pseudobacteroides cellulosolvens TaxID=35825 RepID=A0A0L6JMM4_9FIRM|nr:protein of unknown function DUF1393 [Pseudobacteroides cellulosolvens ATCC 35603 = DSM 2933]
MALIFVTTVFTRISLPKGGYFNLGDVFVMISAVFLGRYYGFFVGGVGSAMADLYMGYTYYAPITLIVKGLEAFVVALLLGDKGAKNSIKTAAAVAIGAFIMVAGYFIAEGYILSFVDKNLGLAAAVTNLPFNLVQGCLSGVTAFFLFKVMAKANLLQLDPRDI